MCTMRGRRRSTEKLGHRKGEKGAKERSSYDAE